MIIRKAIKNDCIKLFELIKELAVYEKAGNEISNTIDNFIESGFGANPVWWAFVAEENNELLGFAMYYIRYSTWKGERMYLEDFVVTEKARRNGIGKLLFDALIVEAKEKKFTGIAWQVLDWNEPAINFYKKYNTIFTTGWVNCNLEL